MIDKYLTADIIDNDALAVDMQKDEEVQVEIPTFVAMGGGGSNIISVHVSNPSPNPVYYWDETKTLQNIAPMNGGTAQALNGLLYWIVSAGGYAITTGDYIRTQQNSVVIVSFLSGGGTLSCNAGGGSGGS